MKTNIKNIALSSYYGYDSKQLPLNISKAEISARRYPCRNKTIIIFRPDKGNGVVIVNLVDYISEANSILHDGSKFTRLDTDALGICLKREGKLVSFLRDTILKRKLIPKDVYRDHIPSGSAPGVLYGLPKVHRDNCPTRPILSAIGTYTTNLLSS